jgi:hypothetical protein
MLAMNEHVSLPSGDQPSIHWKSCHRRDHKDEGQTHPEKNADASPASIAPGITSIVTLSTTSITEIDATSEANASLSAGETALRLFNKWQGHQCKSENEGEHHGQSHGHARAEVQGIAKNHPEDFADGTACQAMQGGAQCQRINEVDYPKGADVLRQTMPAMLGMFHSGSFTSETLIKQFCALSVTILSGRYAGASPLVQYFRS